ncbi:TrmH family RNA methyltransferase [Winogradskyella sp. DF17]|uniref:TrmH family RNA methyltransferase n=1 Tax=Winogradskyella pelagia TaxID=2819984 RepID=A0ABS3T2Z5_9FLAO|nr:TrmH family RNA methyltransferase [Winogradskyella sp. DF17]MBO3116824.1 TrmH family RNA methyltransferase [Winogradskyella sp. DF17]
MQLTHYTSQFEKINFPITLICDNITNAPNIGSLFRTADAFGVETLIFCGEDLQFGKRMKKTSRATEKYVNHKIERNIDNVLKELQASHHIIALEITTQSKPLSHYKIHTSKPIAIIIGNENFGLSESAVNQSHDILHVEMFGYNSSMNVVQATSIALYEITKQLNF